MVRSMTGFARTEVVINGEKATIEVSSVNHRFLELTFRLPGQWVLLEPALRDIVRSQASRGKINIAVRHGRGFAGTMPLRVDTERARQYVEASRELMHLMSSTDALSLDALMGLDGVMVPEDGDLDLDAVVQLLGAGLTEAMAQLAEMRGREGAALTEAISVHLRDLEVLVERVEKRAPELLAAYDAKLRQRIAEINLEVGVKEERLAMEVAMMADRMDVTEELVRFRAHIAHGRELLNGDGPVGRDLNFLVQELQREANTLGSKLRDVEVSRDIIEIKTEIEKVREQLQNLE